MKKILVLNTRNHKTHSLIIRCLLGCDAVWWCGRIPTFRRSTLPPSSGWRWRWRLHDPL